MIYKRQKTLDIKDGVTISTCQDYHSNNHKPHDECTSEEKSLVIVSLLNRMIRDIMFSTAAAHENER